MNFFEGGGRKIQVCPPAPDTLATPLSMADKLAQFEATLAQYDIAIADVKRTNFAIDARVSNMEIVVMLNGLTLYQQ